MLLDPLRAEHRQSAPPKPHARGQSPLLTALLELAQGSAELVSHIERSWASATFAGTRHTITLAFLGVDAVTAGEDLITLLPEHEFTIPDQLVADAAVVAVDHQLLQRPSLTVTLELLLLQDA